MPLSSHDLALFITQSAVDPVALEAAAPAIVDTLAVMIAGSIEPSVARIAATLPVPAATSGFAILDAARHLRAGDAALLYGTASHALDYDDVSMLAICHPSAPVLSALLATARWQGADGRTLCEAHAIGTEVMVRMGQAIGIGHYAIGFHTTATLGLFGAVAALARLRGLDAATTHTALAIGASMSGGMRLNFGTDVKPLHVGLAASNAVRAVEWAQAGVTACKTDLFAPGGVLATLGGGGLWPDDIVLGQPFAIAGPGFEQKRFPGCYMLHKVMALGIEIAQAGIGLGQIAGIEVVMPRGGTRPLIHPVPNTGAEALFSIPYSLLAAITDGDVTFATFTGEAVGRGEIRARLGDVSVTEAGEEPATGEALGAAPVSIRLRLADGASRVFTRKVAPGSPLDPMTAAQRRAKWVDCLRCAHPALAPERTSEAYDAACAALRSGHSGPWLSDLWQLMALPDRSEKALCHDRA